MGHPKPADNLPLLFKYWSPALNLAEELKDPRIGQMVGRWLISNQQLEAWKDPDLPPYQPSPKHWAIHLSPAKEKLIAGGERGGKSRAVCQEAFGIIPDGTPGRYWVGGQKYEDAEVEFQNLVGLFQSIGALPLNDRLLQRYVKTPQDRSWVAELQGDFAGTIIETKSVGEVSNLKARSVNGVVLCEAALISAEAFKRAQGRIAERDGWLWASGTFEKQKGSWYAEMYDRWKTHAPTHIQQCFSLPTADNPVLFPRGREDQRYLRMIANSDQDRIMLRFEGQTVPNRLRVFPQFDPETHVGDYGFNARQPVWLAIDPGWTTYAVLALQVTTDGSTDTIRVIDEIFGHNTTREEIIMDARARPWWGNVPARDHVMDIAGKQHQQGGDTELDAWWQLAGLHIDVNYVKLEQGIDRLASFLETTVARNESGQWIRTDPYSRLLVNRRCEELAHEFAMHQYPEHLEPEERRIPIDRWNHGLKALGYWLHHHYELPGDHAQPMMASFGGAAA